MDGSSGAPASGRSKSAVHVNPNFKGRVSPSPSGVHLNPRLAGQAHLNPNFQQLSSSNVHLNPKFANRPLPSLPKEEEEVGGGQAPLPHVNPRFLPGKEKKAPPDIDEAKKEGYHQAIAKSVAGKVFVNPKFGERTAAAADSKTVYVDPSLVKMRKMPGETKKKRDSPGSEKENRPKVVRKSVFKKIGNKKLIRIRKDSSTCSTPKQQQCSPAQKRRASGEMRKIGTRKLIRVKPKNSPQPPKRVGTPRQHQQNLSWKSRFYRTPPPATTKKRSVILRLVTPLSLRKVRVVHPAARTSQSLLGPPTAAAGRRRNLYRRMLNPFKVDRRKSSKTASAATATPHNKTTTPTTTTSPAKSVAPPKPARTSLLQTPATPAAKREDAVINIQGTKYKVSANGRTLNRIGEAVAAPATPATTSGLATAGLRASNPARASLMSRTLFIEGEEFVEDEDQPGVLVRTRNSMTRASITNARNRSINTILKSQARSKQYCMFFNKFGRCNKRDKGVCPYIHDKEKVAVCRRFLQGSCVKQVRRRMTW